MQIIQILSTISAKAKPEPQDVEAYTKGVAERGYCLLLGVLIGDEMIFQRLRCFLAAYFA